MADEPSPRAQWNMKMAVNLLILIAYVSLIGIGVVRDAITVTDALALLGSTALGGGIGWFSK